MATTFGAMADQSPTISCVFDFTSYPKWRRFLRPKLFHTHSLCFWKSNGTRLISARQYMLWFVLICLQSMGAGWSDMPVWSTVLLACVFCYTCMRRCWVICTDLKTRLLSNQYRWHSEKPELQRIVKPNRTYSVCLSRLMSFCSLFLCVYLPKTVGFRVISMLLSVSLVSLFC